MTETSALPGRALCTLDLPLNLIARAAAGAEQSGESLTDWVERGLQRLLGDTEVANSSDEGKFQAILRVVSGLYGLEPSHLTSHLRTRHFCEARHMSAHLARKYTNFSYPAIAELMGKRDHTTIINSLKRASQLIDSSPVFERKVRLAEDRLGLRGQEVRR